MSEEIKRYGPSFDCGCWPVEKADGEYVMFSDHKAALAAERKRCREEEVAPLLNFVKQYRDVSMGPARKASCDLIAVVERKIKELP